FALRGVVANIPCVFAVLCSRAPPRPRVFPARRSSDLSAAASIAICSRPRWPVARKGAVGTAVDNPISTSGPTAPYLATGHLGRRSEEHTSELQSHLNLVCRLLLEKKKYANR